MVELLDLEGSQWDLLVIGFGVWEKKKNQGYLEIIGLSPRKNGFANNGDGESGKELVLEKR